MNSSVPVARGARAGRVESFRRIATLRNGLHLIQIKAAATAAPDKAVHKNEDGGPIPSSHFITGGRLGLAGSSRCLLPPGKLPLQQDKQIVFVRHGMSTWNAQSRIQGSSDDSELSEFGKQQVRECASLSVHNHHAHPPAV
jgi:serine/threonine-protein phosphatase PGAM5